MILFQSVGEIAYAMKTYFSLDSVGFKGFYQQVGELSEGQDIMFGATADRMNVRSFEMRVSVSVGEA